MPMELPTESQMEISIRKVEWSEAMSVGIREIDADNTRFARLVNVESKHRRSGGFGRDQPHFVNGH
jgi:hypothetical protein